MDVNRNQWFMSGLVLVFLGLQFRSIDAVVLTPEFTKFVAERAGQLVASADPSTGTLVRAEAVPPKTIQPPEWFSWALISIGAVLVLHSLSMVKPG
ncbi:MAG: hypothetical protein ABIP48_25970 [Planctomycetota bacterium]